MRNQARDDKPLALKLVLYTLAGLLAGTAITLAFAIYNVKSQIAQPNLATSIDRAIAISGDAEGVTAQKLPSETASQPVMPSMMAQADRRFIVMMIPHHEGAVAMAELALSRSQHPEIKQLAAAIKKSQTQEISQMQTWYKRWYGSNVPVWSPGMGMGRSNWSRQQQNNITQPDRGMESMSRRRNSSGSRMNCCMMGGAAGINIYALQNAADFDREFIQQMIPHHQMAVMMSSMVINSAEHPELRNLAKSIVNSQSAEIQQMQQWYQTWYQ